VRKLPYGANWLDLDDMPELKAAIAGQVLFRYQTETESTASQFETAARQRLGVAHALGTHNCTEALRLALLSSRPSVGDVVLIPTVTFVAVAGAVLSCGLIPWLIDVDHDLAFDPARIYDLPRNGDVRIVVAHMEGIVRPLPDVGFVVEDSAQAFGGCHEDGRLAGTVGTVGTFSFHHNKVLTSGEGGLVVTNDPERYQVMRAYHDHGSTRVQGEYPRWDHDAFYGENLVTSEQVAAIQLQQLRHLDEILAGLERSYTMLRERLGEPTRCRVLERRQGDVKLSVRLLFDTSDERDRAAASLTANAVPTWTLERYFLPRHPVLVDRRSIYGDGFPWNMAAKQDLRCFEATHDRLRRILCVPVSPEVTDEKAEQEAEAAVKALEQW
jgi:dTDP-4-amino-4,6-dideoxygalactose transaminase